VAWATGEKFRPLTAEEIEFFDYSAAHYVRLAQKYKKTLDL
jgi:hypothetical protein